MKLVNSKRNTKKINNYQKPSSLSSLAESFKWGIGMGAGSEIAHTLTRGLIGGSSNNQQNNQLNNQTTMKNHCEILTESFSKCLDNVNISHEKCEYLLEEMKKQCNI